MFDHPIMSSPRLFPVNLDPRRHTISLVPMSRDRYRNLSFLDPRSSRMGPDLYTMNFDDLLLYNDNIEAHSAPVHFILHTALCCSTLLARYLDLIPASFVLREPTVLAQIAMFRPSNPSSLKSPESGKMKVQNWTNIFALGIRLLSRTYRVDDIVVIKVNDLCNVLGDKLLMNDARTKIVFLYVGLRTFIVSVLRTEKRRAWLRRRLLDNQMAIQMFPRLADVDTTSLSDAEAGAFLWLLNSALCHRFSMGVDSSRVAVLNGDGVAESPREAVRTVAGFFGFTLEEAQLKEILAHPSVSRYSKDLSQVYDLESRRQDLRKLEDSLGSEADKGIEWALQTKQGLEFGTA
jgi:hypothetical protein